MNVRGECYTKIYGFKTDEWPTIFAIVPWVGDYVKSANGTTLKVITITHTEKKIPTSQEPYVLIELGK